MTHRASRDSRNSAVSKLDFGVEFFEFCASVFDGEVPIDTALLGVGFVRPGFDFSLQDFEFPDSATRKALACHAAQFAFSDVQPTAVFGSMNDVQSADIVTCLVYWKRFVERAFGMRIQIVVDQCHYFAVCVAGVEQLRHFNGPVNLCPARSSRALAKCGQGFGEHKDAGCSQKSGNDKAGLADQAKFAVRAALIHKRGLSEQESNRGYNLQHALEIMPDGRASYKIVVFA